MKLRFPHLTGLFAVAAIACLLVSLGIMPAVGIVAFLVCWQLAQLSLMPQVGRCFAPGLTDAQVKEFQEILDGVKGYEAMFKELAAEGGWALIKRLPELLKAEKERNDELSKDVKKLQKKLISSQAGTGVRWVNGVPFVTNDCALAFSGIYLACAFRQEKWVEKQFGSPDEALEKAASWLGVTKAALTSADIPLPTLYVPQVVELVYTYGQFRQYATVFPMGAGTVNLPQLKAGEDAFGIITASSQVNERKAQAQNVTFTAQKIGGIIRIPTEIEEDTFIPLGQFLARYIARRFAAFEDTIGFLGDNTATYNRYGVGPYVASIAQTPQLLQLIGGKTKPTDATLNDFRAIRALVNAAVLQTGQAAYYMHPSMDALLVTFNTLNNPLVYQRATGSSPATLDGFPIRWVGVMQPYSIKAAAASYLAVFGDLSYWYLGERGAPRVETSREVYFATDEIGMRALERIDVQPMAPDAMSALQTAAQ